MSEQPIHKPKARRKVKLGKEIFIGFLIAVLLFNLSQCKSWEYEDQRTVDYDFSGQ